jgi:SulP family sulfate permease
VLVDLTFAVEVGVVLAAFLFMRRMIEVTAVSEVAGLKPGGQNIGAEILYGNSGEAAAPGGHEKNIEVYEITGPFFFGVADTLQDVLRRVAKKPRTFVLRMRDVPAVDSTGIAALESFLAQCRRDKIRLILSEVRNQPRKALEKAGFIGEIGSDNIKETLEDALKEASSRQDEAPKG